MSFASSAFDLIAELEDATAADDLGICSSAAWLFEFFAFDKVD